MLLDCAATAPIRTLTPSACVARASSCGRNSPIRGTITQCSAPQAKPSSSHAKTTAANSQRDRLDQVFSSL